MTRISLSLLAAAALVLAMPGARAAGLQGLKDRAPHHRVIFSIPAPHGPVIATAGEARRALRRDGMTAIHGLGLIGDYWEAEGLRRGVPVVGYAYRDGTLSIRRATPGQLFAAFGRLPLSRGVS